MCFYFSFTFFFSPPKCLKTPFAEPVSRCVYSPEPVAWAASKPRPVLWTVIAGRLAPGFEDLKEAAGSAGLPSICSRARQRKTFPSAFLPTVFMQTCNDVTDINLPLKAAARPDHLRYHTASSGRVRTRRKGGISI